MFNDLGVCPEPGRKAPPSAVPLVSFDVKGKNVFGKHILIPENLPIDWMHCVCEGILKRQLFHRWFGEAFSGEDYSLSRFTE